MLFYPTLKRLAWLLLIACTVLTPALARGQALEIIPLHNRSAEEIVPQLRPFLEAGASVGGSNSTIFVRASARNMGEIMKLIESLDTPVRRLRISVRQEEIKAADDQGAGVTGSVILGSGAPKVGGVAQIYSSDRHTQRNTHSQVQTIDGGRASIHVGQSFFVPLQQYVLTPTGVLVSQTLVQRDLGTGFVAVPKLSGDQVTLEISPTDLTAASGVGAVNVMRLVTTISGRLGEWLELGGSADTSDANESGITRYGTRSASGRRKVLLKVDELP